MTSAGELLIYMVTLDLSNLEIDSTELDDITDPKLLILIIAVKFFQHLVN